MMNLTGGLMKMMPLMENVMLSTEKKEFAIELRKVMMLYSKPADTDVFSIWWNVLEDYDLTDIKKAFSLYAKNERYPPVPAGVIDYLPSEVKISADEAWAHIPKTDYESAWINQRMMTAYGLAHELLINGDATGARMAFRDSYNNQKEDGKWWWTQPEGISWEDKQSRKLEDYSKVAMRKWLKDESQELLMIETGSKQTLTELQKNRVTELRLITKELGNLDG